MCRFETFLGVNMSKGDYEIASDLETLAIEVIEEHTELSIITDNDVKIAFVRSSQRKKGKNKIVFADTRKVADVYSAFIPYDFIITFYAPNVEMLDEEQKRILMWHELKHCGVDGKGNTYVIPHDIEDFKEIIEKHGMDWAERKQVGGDIE